MKIFSSITWLPIITVISADSDFSSKYFT